MSKSSNPIKRDTSIPRRPLLWMAAALLFTLPPFFDSLAIWVPSLFLLSLGLKFWMEPRGYRLRSVVLKLMLVATAVTIVFFSYSSVRGVEAGISLLVVLMSLKILEAHTAREFRVMVLIGWMLCLSGFFLSQDLTTALCLLIAFALLAVALIQFHRGAAPGAMWPPVVTACKLLLQASPLVVLFFLLFPRINAGLRLELRPFRSANTGFSDRLSPERSQLLQILRRSRSARSFLEAALDRLVRCIGAGSSCGVATAWNGELRTSRGRRHHLPTQTSRAAAASLFNLQTPGKSNSGSR